MQKIRTFKEEHNLIYGSEEVVIIQQYRGRLEVNVWYDSGYYIVALKPRSYMLLGKHEYY